MTELTEHVDGLPNICGQEALIEQAIAAAMTPEPRIDLSQAHSAFAIALHMHQPLIPAGDPATARIIGNLQWMVEHPDIGDNYNASVFHWCYKRMGEFIPQLLARGLQPRIMLDYSGTLLYGLRQMGLHDVLDALTTITCDPGYNHAVEWLGSPWGHAVAPSTPVQDYRLHVRAWQHHFAAIFGLEALSRVRGFSPAEMALPNHPDVAHEFVRTLVDRGYHWVLVQEHTVERADGSAVTSPHVPHRLRCTNSRGDTVEITAVIKTQGSDTELVGQMQPYYEALGLAPQRIDDRVVPPLVTQIADGENGGVMMNEFPPKYFETMAECSGTSTPIVNVSEYIEHLRRSGVSQQMLPAVQPVFQHLVWQRFTPGDGPERLDEVIAKLSTAYPHFHMRGGSWTDDRSWVEGYDDVLTPMERASALFHRNLRARGVPTSDPRYRRALFHLLAAETSCYRYWGQGEWMDYGVEMALLAIGAT
ncbi:hypothetical protein LFM09_34245 [Lentzea alba]|uniref:glycosyl hydrolase family 57 n=1 Tax=Lentzea alba TaxID=2714351 RepID=UPI0039BFBACA